MGDTAKATDSATREARFWRERAAQARELVKDMTLASVRQQQMLLVAEGYDVLAEEAEQRIPRNTGSAASIG